MPSDLHILVVEDHVLLRMELVDFLTRPGWRVRGVDDGMAMDEALRDGIPDIAVVDLNLPGEDGLSICRRLRAALPEVGIVLLTARVMSSDRASGYLHGADVYLTKPANVHELEAVIQNLGRRVQRLSQPTWTLDIQALTLGSNCGAVLHLTQPEARLLYELSFAPEQCLESDVLASRLHGAQGLVTRENLAVMISRLRRKILQDLAADDVIKASRGYGYKLSRPVVVVS